MPRRPPFHRSLFRRFLSHTAPPLVLVAALLVPPAVAESLRLPLDNYPIDDACGPWGFLNPNFPRCGLPGKHVADDACAPAGTPVYAVADGRVMLAEQVGDCFTNWGWVTVAEHTRDDGTMFCSIYGHCQPLDGIVVGTDVTQGDPIAQINFPCGGQHIHFGIALGAYEAVIGRYPDWLLGYLPSGMTCGTNPIAFPGRYVDPVQFVLESTPLLPRSWGSLKLRAE